MTPHVAIGFPTQLMTRREAADILHQIADLIAAGEVSGGIAHNGPRATIGRWTAIFHAEEDDDCQCHATGQNIDNCYCPCDYCRDDSCRSCGTNHYQNPNCSECRDTQDIAPNVRTLTEALAPTEADLAGICPRCHGCGVLASPNATLGSGFPTCTACGGKGVTR